MRSTLPVLWLVLMLLQGCSTPHGGRASATYDRALSETFTDVRRAFDAIGYTVNKEDAIAGEMQGASGPYGIAPQTCQGNELWVYLTEIDPGKTAVVVQEWYGGGSRLLSKPKPYCESHAKKLLAALDHRVTTAPTIIAAPPSALSIPPTKTEQLIDSGIETLALRLGEGIKEHRVIRVAVFPITDGHRGSVTALSTYLADKLTNAIYERKIATVVERMRLVRIMDELAVTASPRFDDKSVKSVGKLAGVDAIVLGVYTSLASRTIEVNVRLVSVETAELLAVGSARIPETAVTGLLR